MDGKVDLSGKKLLVVEDDNMNYIYLSQIFKMTKGDVTRAINGKQALEFARTETFDIILMDIQLPDISGNDVTHQIREFNKNIPIIAQTASRLPEENDQSLAAGCNDILVKPFTLNDFSRVVSRYI